MSKNPLQKQKDSIPFKNKSIDRIAKYPRYEVTNSDSITQYLTRPGSPSREGYAKRGAESRYKESVEKVGTLNFKNFDLKKSYTTYRKNFNKKYKKDQK